MTTIRDRALDNRPSTASRNEPSWHELRPLWDHSDAGWFVYQGDGRLAYMNQALPQLLERRIPLGGTEFVLEVAPQARPAVMQSFLRVRHGEPTGVETVLPVMIGEGSRPMHLTMISYHDDTTGELSVIGTVQRVLRPQPAGTIGNGADQQMIAIEQVLCRVMAELSAVAPTDDAARTDSATWLTGLSERQREVLDLLVQGEAATSIAARLNLSLHTVRNHVKAVFRCLGVHSQAELITQCRSRAAHPSTALI